MMASIALPASAVADEAGCPRFFGPQYPGVRGWYQEVRTVPDLSGPCNAWAMNWWTYRILFAESLAGPKLVERTGAVLDGLVAAGFAVMERDGSIVAMDPVGKEQLFPSAAKAISGLAAGGGGGVTLVRGGSFLDFGFRTSPPGVSVSSTGPLGPGDETEADLLAAAFRSMCELARPVFGSSDDREAAASVWAQWGVTGPAMLKVAEQELADVQAGRLPDVLPWLSYVDKAHFGSMDGLASLPAAAVESVGESGMLVKLASHPWENRFAVRTSAGYEVVDEQARRLTDGARCEPAPRT
jgi:hypothetical protein